MKNLPTYEEWKSEPVNESFGSWLSKLKDKSVNFAKSVWDGAKREKRETGEALRILQSILKGERVTDVQKKFLKAQSIDLVKLIPLVAIQGIPVPIPITPILLLAGKKIGFDILPNSHTKVNYQFESVVNEEWEKELKPNEIEMVKGIVDILLQIKDINNRKEVAATRIEDFKREGIKIDPQVFLRLCGLNEFEGSMGGSTQMTSDLFLATQTAANGIAF
jgi:hypothetical protein